MKMSNAINLSTNENMRNYAKVYSTLINNTLQRKRAYASLMALYSLCSYIEDRNLLDVQKAMTVFRTPTLNEQFEISDFYINNWHIDVRVTVDETECLVPKKHYEYDIYPDFYAVVKVDKDLINFELLGFADAKNVDKSEFDKGYFKIDSDLLLDYSEFIEKVETEKPIKFEDSEHELFKESYLGLIDGNAEKEDIKKVLKHIFSCPECRAEFCCFCGFEMVSKNIQNYPDIFNDDTLNIIGAQVVDDEKYEGKEETIYIGPDDDKISGQSVEDTKAEEKTEKQISTEDAKTNDNVQADTDDTPVVYENIQEYKDDDDVQKNNGKGDVSDILDELFNIEEVDDKKEEEPIAKPAKKPVRIQYIGMDDQPEFQTDNIIDSSEPPTSIVNDDIEYASDNENEENTDDDNIIIEEYPENDDNDYEISKYIDDNEENDDSYISEYDNEEKNDTDDLSYTTDENDVNSVDKVIVDYDEAGKPIYSYINKAQTQDDSLDNIDILDESDNAQNNYDSEINSEYDNIYTEDEQQFDTDYIAEYKDDKNETDNDKGYKIYNTNFDLEENNDEQSKKLEQDEVDEYKDDDELNSEESSNIKKSNKTGLIIALVIVILAIPTAFLTMKTIKTANSISSQQEEVDVPDKLQTDDLFTSEDNKPSEDDLIIPKTSQKEKAEVRNINKTDGNIANHDDINNAFTRALKSSGTKHVSVKGVNWQCAPELFTNKTFKQYLQQSDKVLKMNLNKNILDANELQNNDSVKIKIELDKKGNLLNTQIEQSSGSTQIDNIVLQSIKETIETQKSQLANNSEQKQGNYVLKVVIKL